MFIGNSETPVSMLTAAAELQKRKGSAHFRLMTPLVCAALIMTSR